MTDNFKHFKYFTNISRFVQLHPEDTHSKWAEIVGATAEGMLLKITRIKRRMGTGGGTPSVGDIHFKPWNKLTYKYATRTEATAQSFE